MAACRQEEAATRKQSNSSSRGNVFERESLSERGSLSGTCHSHAHSHFCVFISNLRIRSTPMPTRLSAHNCSQKSHMRATHAHIHHLYTCTGTNFKTCSLNQTQTHKQSTNLCARKHLGQARRSNFGPRRHQKRSGALSYECMHVTQGNKRTYIYHGTTSTLLTSNQRDYHHYLSQGDKEMVGSVMRRRSSGSMQDGATTTITPMITAIAATITAIKAKVCTRAHTHTYVHAYTQTLKHTHGHAHTRPAHRYIHPQPHSLTQHQSEEAQRSKVR